jgi:hypothetical protein
MVNVDILEGQHQRMHKDYATYDDEDADESGD